MAESNTENTIEIGCAKPAETSKLNNFVIYTEYHNEELLYPINVIEKLKRELEIIRTRKDIELRKNPLLVSTSVNGEPKHKEFKTVQKKDTFPVLSIGKDQDKTSSEDQQIKPREKSIDKSTQIDTKNVQKSNKPGEKSLIVEKPIKTSSTRGTQSLKKKTVIRKINNK